MMVLVESWTETERGWGTRPDGWAAYRDKETRDKFVREYWDSMPDHVPAEYSYPDGNAKLREVTNPDILEKINGNGVYQTYERNPQWLKS